MQRYRNPELKDKSNSSFISVTKIVDPRDTTGRSKNRRVEQSSRQKWGKDGRIFLESVPFRLLFSPLQPPPISPSSLYYVVIGLFFEPCDVLLQITLRFLPLPSSPSTPSELSIARPELLRNPVLLERRILPPSLTPSPTPTPSNPFPVFEQKLHSPQ